MQPFTTADAKNIIHDEAVVKEHCEKFCYPSIDKRLNSINAKFWWLIALGVMTALDIGKMILASILPSVAAAWIR